MITISASKGSCCWNCNPYVLWKTLQVTVESLAYHKTCFKCSHGGCSLSPSNYAALEGILYCKHHFSQLFKEKGSYNHLLKSASMKRAAAATAASAVPVPVPEAWISYPWFPVYFCVTLYFLVCFIRSIFSHLHCCEEFASSFLGSIVLGVMLCLMESQLSMSPTFSSETLCPPWTKLVCCLEL